MDIEKEVEWQHLCQSCHEGLILASEPGSAYGDHMMACAAALGLSATAAGADDVDRTDTGEAAACRIVRDRVETYTTSPTERRYLLARIAHRAMEAALNAAHHAHAKEVLLGGTASGRGSA